MSRERYKTLRSLNISGTAVLVKDPESGRKYVLRNITDESIPVYRRISELPSCGNLTEIYSIDGNTALCGFAEGKSLDELIGCGRIFSAAQIRKIISQLCNAAAELHSCVVIHRDISPGNIIIDDDMNLTLTDYGIARIFSGNKEQDTEIYGTAGFAAPEQYGFRETDVTADIYSIGSILRLLLEHSTDCPAVQEVLLRRIASKCMRFDPDRRYSSAKAVRNAIIRSAGSILALSAAVLIIAAVTVSVLSFSPPDAVSVPQEETDAASYTAPSGSGGGPISIETIQTPRGFYSDVFEYSFTDDPSLHGTWTYVNTIPIRKANADLTQLYINEYRYVGMHDFYEITFGGDGDFSCRFSENRVYDRSAYWTSGYLIFEYPTYTAAQSVYTADVEGTEYLFLERKNAAYKNSGEPPETVEIYIRKE